uniref:Uncharacterized protein n=1 Tax=Mesocestoides corti TaxID=53468 RepID=A0A5K3FA10_MESCO
MKLAISRLSAGVFSVISKKLLSKRRPLNESSKCFEPNSIVAFVAPEWAPLASPVLRPALVVKVPLKTPSPLPTLTPLTLVTVPPTLTTPATRIPLIPLE